jgi:hypothetical protein
MAVSSLLPAVEACLARTSATPRLARREVAALGLIAVLYLGALGRVLGPADFNPLVLARVSHDPPAERFWDQAPPFFNERLAYDGRFFYYLARDPLLRGGPPTYLDSPAYRYQRILLPALAHLLALGRPAAVGWGLVAANLLGVALGCRYALQLARHFRAPAWWLLGYALNPGLLIGTLFDLSEPLAVGLCTAACAFAVRRRPLVAALLLSAALLARETVALVAVVFLVHELLAGRSVRRALPYALPLLVAAAWQAALGARFGQTPLGAGAMHLGWPLAGVIQRVGDGLPLNDAALLASQLAVLALALVAGLALVGLRSRSVFGWQLAAQGGFLLTLSAKVWESDAFLSVARMAMLLYLFLLLATAEARAQRAGWNPGRSGVSGAAGMRAPVPPAPAEGGWTIP